MSGARRTGLPVRPPVLRTQDLDYALPPELVAQHPVEHRDRARMLVVDRGRETLHDATVSELGAWLRSGDVLVLNETRVRPARLTVRRETGGRVSLLFVHPIDDDRWTVLARPARHAPADATLRTEDGTLELRVAEEGPMGARTVHATHGSIPATLDRIGDVPLPPYIRRESMPEDRERYQTVFARVEGAVAAPTAGLHFTPELLEQLATRGVDRANVVLHVGPGTFRPIRSGDPRRHRLDAEYFEVSAPAVERLLRARGEGGRVVGVGTTVVRALESAADAHGGGLGPARGWTEKLILPPYEFRWVDALLTNFHLPRTTLLMLVAAFAGTDLTRRAYAHAVRERYRFYSYGDSMLVI